MNESNYHYWLALEDGKTIQFSDLAHLIAQALHPTESECFDYGFAILNLDEELRHLVRDGELLVRNPSSLARQTFPVGDALNRSVLMTQDLLPLLESKGIEIRLIPYGSGARFWTIANAAAEIAKQENWHDGSRRTFQDQMLDAAKKSKLIARNPHTNLQTNSKQIRDSYELVTVSDVNAWLNSEGVHYKWTAPETNSEEFDYFKSSSGEQLKETLSANLINFYTHSFYDLPRNIRGCVNQAFKSKPFGAGLWDELSEHERQTFAKTYDESQTAEMLKASQYYFNLQAQISDVEEELRKWELMGDQRKPSEAQIRDENIKRLQDEIMTLRQTEKPIPNDDTSTTATSTQHGITTKQSLTAFELIAGKCKLRKVLADKPKWIVDACIERGARGKRQGTWNPVILAIALLEKNYSPKVKLTRAFHEHNFLSVWRDEWNEKSDF